MRTVIYTFDGDATDGDVLLVSYRAQRGGESTAKCVIVTDPKQMFDPFMIPGTALRRGFKVARDLEDAARVLADEINSSTSEWAPGAGDFRAVAKGRRLSVMCSTLLSDVSFHFNVDGKGTETCEIEVLE